MNATRVLAIEVNGRNRIFNSINECCDYYTDTTDSRLQVEQLRRLLAGHGLWEYVENGVKKQVVFDELY